MATRRNPESETSDKGKIRFFYAEVEGNNQTLQDAIKTMVTALTRPPVNGNATRVANNAPAANAIVETIETASETEEQAEVQELGSIETADAAAASGRKSRGSGAKRDYNAGIELVSDLDFRPDGKQSLRDFFGEKRPRFDMDQVLVVLHYMQHAMEVPAITLGHIRTAFKDVEKPFPTDIRSTVRNMKKGKAWVSFGDKMESIRVTSQGDNYVEHDLPEGGQA